MAFNLNVPPSAGREQPVRNATRLQVNGARYELRVASAPALFAGSRFRFAASAFLLIAGSALLGFQLQPARQRVQYDMTPTGSIAAKIDAAQAKARACN